MKKYILILLMVLPVSALAGHVSIGVNVGPVIAIGYSNVHCAPAIIPYYGEPLAVGYYYDDDGFLCYKHNRSALIIRYTEYSRHNMRHRMHRPDHRYYRPSREHNNHRSNRDRDHQRGNRDRDHGNQKHGR